MGCRRKFCENISLFFSCVEDVAIECREDEIDGLLVSVIEVGLSFLAISSNSILIKLVFYPQNANK